MNAQPAVRMTPGRVVREFFRWLIHSIPSVLISAIFGAAVGWATNVYRIAIAGGSSPDAPAFSGSVVSGSNRVNAGLFWAIGSTVFFGIIGYRRAVGGKRFWREIRSLPRAVGTLFKRDGSSARIHLLWGAAGSLVASSFISVQLRTVLAVGVLAGAPSIVGRALSSLGMRIWSQVQHRLSPGRGKQMEGITSMTVGILGAGLALAVAAFVVQGRGKIYIAIACAVAAVALGRMHKPMSATGVIVLFASAFAFIEMIHVVRAFADDGGWSECAQTLGKAKIGITDWLSSKCAGQADVFHAASPAAVVTGGFAPVGLFIGHLSGLGGGGRGGGGTKVGSQPPQPIIDADGHTLVVNNGEWPDVPKGWVFYGGDKGWLSPDKANEEIAKDIAANTGENIRKHDWADKTAHDHETQMHTRVTQLENEALHEKITNQIRDRANRDADFIRTHMQDIPMSQWDKIDELVDKLNSSNAPNLGDLERIQRLKHATFNIGSGATDRAAADAQNTAAWAGLGLDLAQSIHTGAKAAEFIVMAAPLAGAAAAMVGAQSLGGFLVSQGAVAAGLGAFHVGRNAIEGAALGYIDGGPKGALVGMVKKTLPVNSAITIYKMVEGEEGGNVGQLGISMLEDLGNAMQLHAGATQISKWTRGTVDIPGGSRALEGPPNPKPKTPEDIQVVQDRIQGRNLARDYQKLEKQLAANPDDPALQAQIRNKVNEINANYQSKVYMKNRPPEVQKSFNGHLQKEYEKVDKAFTQGLNDAGLRRGGNEFHEVNTYDVRNATSTGVGMDRDKALDERFLRFLKDKQAQVGPGSPEGIRLQRKIAYVEGQTQLTQVMPDGSVKKISPSEWNDQAQKIYNKAFQETTGQSAEKSLQGVTTAKNPEAYADMAVLKNQPESVPFSKGHAAQTASVTTQKVNHAEHTMKPGDAHQEIARGTGKDIGSKLEPLLRNQNAPPEIVQKVNEYKEFLNKYGKGEYLPSQANALAQQRFGTDIKGLTDRTTAMLHMAILKQ